MPDPTPEIRLFTLGVTANYTLSFDCSNRLQATPEPCGPRPLFGRQVSRVS